MQVRYPAALVLTLALTANPAGAHSRHRQPRTQPQSSLRAGQLYSSRALRRARIILQLELLELRSEHLDRVRRAIERRLPVDQLLKS